MRQPNHRIVVACFCVVGRDFAAMTLEQLVFSQRNIIGYAMIGGQHGTCTAAAANLIIMIRLLQLT